jgi:RHS repeat-associated protein
LTYTGREDDQTGLLYYRARYYDPEAEIFISQDPLGDAQRYVGGNPLSFTDPLGLAGIGLQVGGSAEAGLGFGGAITASAGLGVFNGGKSGLNTGGFVSNGSFSGLPKQSSCRFTKNTPQGVIGLFAGVGGGLFFTNANSALDLGGIGNTTSFNLGIGPAKFGLQYTEGPNGINVLGITFGPGGLFSLSNYDTNTETTK